MPCHWQSCEQTCPVFWAVVNHTVAFLEKMADLPGKVDFSQCKGVGPFGLMAACSSKEVREGLGVVMELTRAMGRLGDSDEKKPDEEAEETTAS